MALFIWHDGEGVGGLLASEKKKVTMTEWGVVGMILTPYPLLDCLLHDLKILDTILPSREKITWSGIAVYVVVTASALWTWCSILKCNADSFHQLTYYSLPDMGVRVSVHSPVWKSSDISCPLISFLVKLRRCLRDIFNKFGGVPFYF